MRLATVVKLDGACDGLAVDDSGEDLIDSRLSQNLEIRASEHGLQVSLQYIYVSGVRSMTGYKLTRAASTRFPFEGSIVDIPLKVPTI